MKQHEDILTKALASQDYLMHHGILGQKWGVRRYQNPDGSLTDEGRKRYLDSEGKLNKKGSQRYLDNGDGTYFDATKYSRTLGPVGGFIDLARAIDHDKKLFVKNSNERKNAVPSHSEEYDTVSKKLKTDGWDIDESGDFGGDIYATSNGKFGQHTIRFSTIMDPGDVGGYVDEVSNDLSNVKDRMQQNSKQIISQCKKKITEQVYDQNLGDIQNTMSRSEFMNSIRPYGASINSGNWSHLTELNFTADGVHGHSLDIEYNLRDLKPSQHVSMNG